MAKKQSKTKSRDYTQVVPRYGELYSFGLYYPETLDTHFEPIDPQQVALCKKWLELHARPRKTINFREGSSYGFKHRVERWCETFGPHRYIGNGAFIRAAIDLGYKYVQRGPNAHFNIAPRGPALPRDVRPAVRDVIKGDDERALVTHRRGRKFTWDEHAALGKALNDFSDGVLREAFTQVSRTYTKRESHAVGRVIDAIASLESVMDDRACAEHPEREKNPTRLYFPIKEGAR